ncbi:leucine-rich repeat domain-containing protein [Luteolibacter soli]|uniref:Leucine-rich repeat domain-containing protein n=1 Tax=Luteolibacter soli TaxID=3135280 RepID=A0ABU9AWQ7_9BACT
MRAHSLFRPFVFIAACLAVIGSALAQTFGNFSYGTDGTSITIIGHTNVAVNPLVIPAEINGLPVRSILRLGASPNSNLALRQSVTSVVIPEGVTSMGASVFANFTSLTSVTLPNSLTSLGDSAFSGCTSLTSATFGNGVTSLTKTFEGCTSLVTVDLPDPLVTLTSTFSDCSSLTSIQIPASVTTIYRAFKDCTHLGSVQLPASMTALGQAAFMGCASLQSVGFPAGLVSIGEQAFQGCTGLASVALPPSLITVGPNAFEGCTGLASVNFSSSLATISSNAFSGCSGLTSLSFPPSLKTIEGGAFYACTGLTSLTVPDTVETIGDSAFWGCTGLTSVSLPSRFLASIANLGLDHEPQLATDLLITGLAKELTNSPDFISKLADAIIAKSGHYGLSTQADITTVVNQTPQTVRDVLAEVGAEAPVAPGITSDLGTLTVKKGKPVEYAVTTTFGATAFAAIGLPDGVVIDAATGAISGKAKKPGTYNVFLHAGVPGGGAVSAVKVIAVTN